MRVLLDECVPRRLKHDLIGHDVRTAPEMGWASKSNGELLALAAGGFDVLLTVDRNLSYRHDVSAVNIAVVVSVARSNALDILRPLVPLVRVAQVNPKRGAVTVIKAEGESQANGQI